MNVIPSRHELSFGEMLTWRTLAGAAAYFVWRKSSAEDASPRWVQVRGWNVLNDSRIEIAGETTALTLDRNGVIAEWNTLLSLFDGYDPEVVMITAMAPQGVPQSIDRFAVPAPNSTDASTIAAQERRMLQTLLEQRSALAQASAGHVKLADPSGTAVELADLATVDRRVAEVRARIRWFELASTGNIMPRAEHW